MGEYISNANNKNTHTQRHSNKETKRRKEGRKEGREGGRNNNKTQEEHKSLKGAKTSVLGPSGQNCFLSFRIEVSKFSQAPKFWSPSIAHPEAGRFRLQFPLF